MCYSIAMSMFTQDKTDESEDKKPTRVPVAFSALVLPGVGQCMQRRWLAGVFYGIGFLVCLGLLLLYAGKILYLYYSAWEMEDSALGAGGSVLKILFVRLLYSFGASMVMYIANILDAHRAYTRAVAQWLGRQRIKRLENALGTTPPPLK